MDDNKKMVLLDGNLCIILAAIIAITTTIGMFFIGYKIGRHDEKISALEDIVFNNDVYPNIKKIKAP